jgi:hypothetical protein
MRVDAQHGHVIGAGIADCKSQDAYRIRAPRVVQNSQATFNSLWLTSSSKEDDSSVEQAQQLIRMKQRLADHEAERRTARRAVRLRDWDRSGKDRVDRQA